MSRWSRPCVVAALAAGVVAGPAACSQQEPRAAAPIVEEKTFSLAPSTAPVKASFLVGELRDMKAANAGSRAPGRS